MSKNRIFIFILIFLIILPNIVFGEKTISEKEVYFLSINKLALEDLEYMPNLQKISDSFASGLMNTRGSNGYSGAESFATINASSKTHANDISAEFEETGEGYIKNSATGRIYNLNDDNKYNPDIGILGDKLKDNGLITGIFGNSDIDDSEITYAALIAMNSEGIIDQGKIKEINNIKPGYPYDISTNYEMLMESTINSDANFKVLDLGDLERLYRYSSNYTDEEYYEKRKIILSDMDRFIESLYNKIKNQDNLMIITSPNAPDSKITNNRLAPLIMTGNNMEKSGIISKTTNRNNIVGNIDLAPTILEFFEIETEELSGSPISFDKNIKNDYYDLLNESNQIKTVSNMRYKSLMYYASYSIVLLLIIIIITLGRFRLSPKIAKIKDSLLAMIIYIPTVFLFISILRPDNILKYFLMTIGIIIIGFILDYRTGIISDRLTLFSAFNIILIIMDLIMKGKISRFSVLSHDPIIGARYYGIGNELIGLLLGNLAIFMSKIKEKLDGKLPVIINIILLLVSVFLVGHPKLGANLGGTFALFSVFVFYIIEEREIKIKFGKLILIGLLGIILFFTIGYMDIRFNPNTTHLGNTVLLIINSGIISFMRIVFRKLLMNIKLIGSSFWTYVLLFSLLSLIILVYKKEKLSDEGLIPTIAVTIGVIVGFILNDSGLILAAICMNFIAAENYILGSEKFEKKKIG